MKIRPYQAGDWPALWTMLRPVFEAGETYAYAPDISEPEAHKVWIDAPAATYVVEDEALLGTYYIKPNQPGLGDHVCNCGYVTAEAARGRGVASALCEHSQDVARAMGFHAMQYNLVAASNEGALRLWRRHGFESIGVLPQAFRHKLLGLTDAHVMYKLL